MTPEPRTAILGTAGHIDHGKTTLVAALTGVDTDRLQEEKDRGISIDLGFAELAGDGVRLGVVDVPGHEGFVRNMLAGATGMDVALLVVAGDEGVMPQTREHLAILSLLGVRRLVVALTRIDLADPDWLELVEDEVAEVVEAEGWRDAMVLRVSARSGEGVEALRQRLLDEGRRAARRRDDDLADLPIDRVFTVRGTGTVVTGTLLSGRIAVGDRVTILPGEMKARVRGVQIHGRDVEGAGPGSRTAVALTGEAIQPPTVTRGLRVVGGEGWEATHRITVAFRVLAGRGWTLTHNQRVRVHLGTAEVMARCVLFGAGEIGEGESGWGQLRLETPLVTRGGERGVIRSYSPVTTIAGIRVIEPAAPRRARGSEPGALRLDVDPDAPPAERVAAVLERAGTAGVQTAALPVQTGLPPDEVTAALATLAEGGARTTPRGRVVAGAVAEALAAEMVAAVERAHADQPWSPGVGVEMLRARISPDAAEGVADLLLDELAATGVLEVDAGRARRAGFQVRLDEARQRLRDDVLTLVREGGLAPPFVEEWPEHFRADPALGALVEELVRRGALVELDHTLYLEGTAARKAVAEVRRRLGGREGLGPADFREALPVTRRHLLPILAWLDRTGVTIRDAGGERTVPLSP